MARSRDLQTLIDTVESVTGEMLPVPGPVARRALTVVAGYAHDADDCRLLLRALGLMPDDERAGGAAVVAGGPAGMASSVPASGDSAGSAPTAAASPASPRSEDAAPVRDGRGRP
ncbi:hypothetical protein J2S46_007187 [Kitasatospora herbaricolor]|uniref:hypothetical protein n=1 Tax=Kitasatospora herbaricolor TaxID=68217 RepID=UPI001749D63E|nr:hypothetical protein [Kitasatospora herbaricolor]MDQ0312631.1 hypothetical protein [Kitasatospora herbaricolor]